MGTNAAVSDARRVGHLFEFRTLELEVPASAADEVARAAQAVADHARCAEPGTRLFAVLRDRERAGRFLCTAVFDDEDAARAHDATAAAHCFAAVLLAAGATVRADAWSAIAGI